MAYDQRQVMLTLSYIAFSGFYRTGLDANRARDMRDWIRRWLDLLDPVKGQWELVWGPATYRIPFTLFDDNMMFAVRHREERERFTVVVRGTNPVSWPNWVFEDFMVLRQWRWTHADSPPGDPRISTGIKIGLEALLRMKPRRGQPGAGMTLREYLRQQALGHGDPLRVCVTGHSLGGALAPTYALYLHDTRTHARTPERAPWDPERSAELSTVSFAGPTPGNADFAAWFDAELGARCDRMRTTLDIVPHAWDVKLLAGVDDLYATVTPFPFYLRPVLPVVLRLLRSRNYTHLRADQPPIEGRLEPLFADYFAQAAYQHVVSYPEVLGLGAELLEPRKHEPIVTMQAMLPHARAKGSRAAPRTARHPG